MKNSGSTNKTYNSTQSTTNTTKDKYSNHTNYDSVEPLPESSRPRRDGPGGEDAE